jgi:hypothetical protein
MRKVSTVLSVIFLATLFAAPAFSRPQQDSTKEKPKEDDMKDCPMHAQHMRSNKSAASADSHQSTSSTALKTRGNAAMGFEQSKTTHHFLLKPGGGAIQVQANDPQDGVSLGQIRMHFRRIATAFAEGDFQIPMIVHTAIPPDTSTMKRLRGKIQYVYEETPAGARVVIKTTDLSALDAIHDFLRYQIHEHETGDPETRLASPQEINQARRAIGGRIWNGVGV